MSFRRQVIDILYSSKLLKSIIFNPLAEFHQWRLLRFVQRAASSTSAGQRVIDVGAGELKYKTHFSHCQYVSNDLCIGDGDWSYAGIDIVSSAYDIPVENDSFDAVLCIQVLEHLDAPDLAFEEFRRILKPGGYAYISAPLLFGEHQQPHDFFRFTRYGLISLGERHGLKVLSLEPHGGRFIATETTFWAALWEILPLPRQTFGRYFIYSFLYPIKVMTGLLALTLDIFDRKNSITINYDVIYQKVA